MGIICLKEGGAAEFFVKKRGEFAKKSIKLHKTPDLDCKEGKGVLSYECIFYV